MIGSTNPRVSDSFYEELLGSKPHDNGWLRPTKRTIQFPGTEPSKGSGERFSTTGPVAQVVRAHA